MATIYALSMTTSFYDDNFKKTASHTNVVGAYQSERDVKNYLMSRVQSYEWRLEQNRLNRIKLNHNSVAVNIYEEDKSCTLYEWRYTEIELQ